MSTNDLSPRRRRGSGKATLRDIAAAAGVSVATASRALSRPDLVSQDLQTRIAQICAKMAYIPNHAARSLTLNRSRALGLVVPTISNPVFSPLIEAVQACAEEHGYGLLIHCCHRDSRREAEQCRTLIERGVDGVMLANPLHEPGLLKQLVDRAVPSICVGGSIHGLERPAVVYDAGAAIGLALDHLFDRGHSRIAVLSGPASITPVIDERFEAAINELTRRGIAPPSEWRVQCGYHPEEARRGVASILATQPRPTAILCTGDLHALAVIAECHASGLSVPDEISVVGCNDLTIVQFTNPPLTTVATPYHDMGAIAAELLLRVVEGEPIPSWTVLPSSLVPRGTVRSINAGSSRFDR
jgi:LacI family transcriptional regulator